MGRFTQTCQLGSVNEFVFKLQSLFYSSFLNLSNTLNATNKNLLLLPSEQK